MAPRLIVHAGFHKTGTTSVQKTLVANAQALAPHLSFRLRADMMGLCEAARAWSVKRDPLDLALVQYEAVQVLDRWAGDTPLLLSSEDLSGHMPGRRGLTQYDAAPPLAAAMAEAWQAACSDVEITFAYSTRHAEPWLRSCYGQHLRATRITMDEEAYVRNFAPSADLAGVMEQVRHAAQAEVINIPLEDAKARVLGPLDPLLDLLELPQSVRSRLRALPPANTAAEPEKRAAMLALNRSDLQGDAFRAARKALNKSPNEGRN